VVLESSKRLQDTIWIRDMMVAPGGILGGLPSGPKAYSGVHVTSAISLGIMVAKAISQPLIVSGMGASWEGMDGIGGVEEGDYYYE